jgi:uncharacterized membrane protein required for colicin V production
MLIFFTLLIMVIVGYAKIREGLFTSAALALSVVLAGVLAFNFWEPLTDALGEWLDGGILDGYEDALVLTLLFTIFFGLLRAAVSRLVPQEVYFPGYEQQVGAIGFGLVTGYLLAGFLLCVLQTLPWHENFFGFEPKSEDEPSLRKYLPPDRAWLGLMRHAGALPLAWKVEKEDAESPYERYRTFDSAETFEERYRRYRRYGDKREPQKYKGERDRELHRGP